MSYIMDEFIRYQNAFNYMYDKTIKPGEEILLPIPPVGPNKRSVNDIGWQTDSNDIYIYGTVAKEYGKTNMWSELADSTPINKTVTALKIINRGKTNAEVCIRIILC